MSKDEVEKVLDFYIQVEKDKIQLVEEMDGEDGLGSDKYRLHRIYQGRIDLLENVKMDLGY